MPRLRRADCAGPGVARRRRGRGFEYRCADGTPVTDEDTRQRIAELAIPPAWNDVWICPDPLGHLQATGIDDAGRKQYLYHQRWREHRDRAKFDDMLDFAAALPRMRRRVARDLAREELDRDRVLACAVRLLDRGFFRIGSEQYADANSTYGLATLLKRHVDLGGDGRLVFRYPAKGGQQRAEAIVDADAFAVVAPLRRRRGGGDELLAWRNGRRWRDVRSEEINDYLRDAAGIACSAKDFRTWNATVLAAVALAVSAQVPRNPTARKRAVRRAVEEVARYLGNTPAVCRASYIDPRVIDRFDDGDTIPLPTNVDLADDAVRRKLERSVLKLIG